MKVVAINPTPKQWKYTALKLNMVVEVKDTKSTVEHGHTTRFTSSQTLPLGSYPSQKTFGKASD